MSERLTCAECGEYIKPSCACDPFDCGEVETAEIIRLRAEVEDLKNDVRNLRNILTLRDKRIEVLEDEREVNFQIIFSQGDKLHELFADKAELLKALEDAKAIKIITRGESGRLELMKGDSHKPMTHTFQRIHTHNAAIDAVLETFK